MDAYKCLLVGVGKADTVMTHYVHTEPIGGEFERELADLISKYNKEDGSNTPDFQLARYLVTCLEAFDRTVNFREAFYGRPTPDVVVTSLR